MEKPTVGMTVRRSGCRLRSMAKAHGPLHVLLWQAREAQTSLQAAASAQKTLFNDIAAWASTENRALNDVCSCVAELGSLYTSALAHLALAYKSFRKEMGLILEGERRCDSVQRKLHEAEEKRIKLRRQVLRAQNRVQTNGNGDSRQTGDFSALQTQLAEAERGAERAHMEACTTSREQEAVKLVVVKSALTKLSESHLKLVSASTTIFEGSRELATEVPEPPPPGDPISCIRYTGYDNTKALVERVKGHIQMNTSFSSSATPCSSRTRLSLSRPVSSSTPLTSPNSSSVWSPEPNAPSLHEPPPPYNMSYISKKERSSKSRRSRSLSHCLDVQSPAIMQNDENSPPAPITNSSIYPDIEIENNTSNNASFSAAVSSNNHLLSRRLSNLGIGGGGSGSDIIMTLSDNSIPSAESPRYANFDSSNNHNLNITASPARSNIF